MSSNKELDARLKVDKRSPVSRNDRGWTAKGVAETDKKINTLSGLIKKVGPKSSRYEDLVASKARQIAARAKISAVPRPVADGIPTVNTRNNTGKGYQKDLMKTRPEGFGTKKPYNFNLARPEELAAKKKIASDQFSSRKSLLQSDANKAYYKKKALAKVAGK